MTKFKKLMAVAAVSMLGIQLMGVGTAFAGPPADVDSECDFGSDNLEITLGYDNAADPSAYGDKGDAGLWVGSDGMLYCEDETDTYSQAVSSIDSITVEMDDDDSNGQLTIFLDDIPDGAPGGTEGAAADWPDFDTFDVNTTTRLVFDGSYVESGSANKLKVTVGKSTFSFLGTAGTYAASAVEFVDGGDDDVFDASKATVRVYADGEGEDTNSESGEDVYKGGSGNDKFELSDYSEDLIVYGNAGNDLIETGSGDDQGWGGAGSDTIDTDAGDDVAAPGADDDDVSNAETVTYADLTGGVEIVFGETDGAAGDDDLSGYYALVGSAGDDVIVDVADVIKGGAGDDVIKCADGCGDLTGDDHDGYASGGAGNDFITELGSDGEITGIDGDVDNVFYGNSGADVLKGRDGADVLRGGPGSDQAWGGNDKDTCTAEVTNRCEYAKL